MAAVGLALFNQGRLDEAEALFQRSLTISDKIAPEGPTSVANVLDLMALALERGNRVALDALAPRMQALIQALPPTSQDAGRLHAGLGAIEAQGGDLAAAQGRYQTAVAIFRRVAPVSAPLARAYHHLGELHRRRQRWPEALEAHREAIEVLEAQSRRLRGGEGRVGFGVRHARLYQACIETLLEAGRTAEAFGYWERSRARALLEMMTERDLAIDAELPAELRRRRRAIDAEYERAQAALAEAKEDEHHKRLDHLRQLRIQRQDLAEQARQASPSMASVIYPQPLGLDQARGALDPGTLFLAFAVGQESSRLFVLEGPGGVEPSLAVFTLPAGENVLRERVARFRALVTAAAPSPGQPLAEEARSLFALLLGPAEAHLARARRLLISPDGPLHSLPFAALRHAAQGRPEQFLVEWKPLHFAVSATLYAELRKRPADPWGGARRSLVTFGDPRYGDLDHAAARLDDPELRRLAKRGGELLPLPGTRAEVQAIARLFPRPAVYLGRDATEERAKAIDRRARYVHFASHALLDERSALDSALALATPGAAGQDQDNGLLHAWEIMEHQRLDADLVTLSACESGGGSEAAGEGLLGLTRAFHYAGARSVLSSLWNVSDDSTAVLMKRFYAELRKGRSKDEALRQAQASLLSNARYARPYDWAAFQLSGDWR